MGKNAIVGQSGGPTSVINASLAGVFESCKNRGADIVYGMCNGVAGLLEERVVDLSTLLTDDLDIELLKRTPSSFLGSCRYKLPDWRDDEAVYKKLFAILEKLNIGYFFYIGGNDSMDTIGKLADYGQRVGSDIRFMGVPKTIDNDLMVTDHTPGYGSAAKYIGVVMKEIIRDATVYGTKYVTVVEIMGRNAGWLTAAAALAKSDDCEGVDMICLPEVPFNVERFVEKVRVMQEKKPSIVIAVSEGVKLEDGRYEGNNKIVLKVLSTLLVMYILTGAALFLLAFLLYKMELTENIVTIGIMVIYVVSGLLGGIIIGKRMKTRRFLWGILIGGAYFVVLLIGSLLMNQGISGDGLHVGMTLIMCMGAGMIGGMIS